MAGPTCVLATLAVLAGCGDEDASPSTGGVAGTEIARATTPDTTGTPDTTMTTAATVTTATSSQSQLTSPPIASVPLDGSLPPPEPLPEAPPTVPVDTVEAPPELCDHGREPVLLVLDRAAGTRRSAMCVPIEEEPELIAVANGVALLTTYGRGAGPGAATLVALDSATAEELWSTPLADVLGPPGATSDGARFYLRELGTDTPPLDVVDARTGELLWELDGAGVVWHGEDGVVVALPTSQAFASFELRGVDPETGDTRWSTAYDAPLALAWWGPDSLASSDTLYLPIGDGDGVLTHAIDIATGEERWTAPFRAVLAGGRAVLGETVGDEMQLGGWRPDTGEQVWVGGWAEPASSPTGASFAQDRDFVLVHPPDGGTAIVDVGSGEVRADAPQLDAAWSADDGSLVTGYDPTVSLVDLETGDVRWTTAVRDPDLVAYVANVMIDGDDVLVSIVNNSGA